MNFLDARGAPHRLLRAVTESAWPAISGQESELQRKQKVAIRCAQLAVAALVIAPAAGALLSAHGRLSHLQLAVLFLGSPLYILWSLWGLRDVIRSMFQPAGPAPAPPRAPGGNFIYFPVQLALAGALAFATGNTEDKQLGWLLLLPPVAHSVIFLRWPGIAFVSATSLVNLMAPVAVWYGWSAVPSALVAFSFAVFFTLVFTLLAVSSERSRAEVERLVAELNAANQKLRHYAVQAEEFSMTRERNRLAREIHDSLGHYLTVVNVQIEAARALWERDPARAQEALGRAQSFTREGLQDIRRSVATLRAAPLDNTNLIAALRQMAAESIVIGLPAELQVLGAERPLSPPTELTLYRVGQEGFTNVRKHAQASRVSLALDFRAPEQVSLRVSDDGAGAAANPRAGFGLLGLRERAQLLGGALSVRTAPRQGFTLEVTVPA